jgi:hypothetical protein
MSKPRAQQDLQSQRGEGYPRNEGKSQTSDIVLVNEVQNYYLQKSEPA